MRARLDASDAVPGELRRNFLAVLDRALAEVDGFAGRRAGERAEAVRQVRKATKALRAMIPLLEGVASRDARAGAERSLADAAGVLSPVRDRDAMLAIIARLLGTRDDARARSLRGELTAALVPDVDPLAMVRLDEMLVERAATELVRVRRAAESWEFGEIECDRIESALARSWRGARRLARSGWDEEADERAHDLRKQCSRLALQVGLLEERDRSLRGVRRKLKRICDLLGEEHDLAMLSERVALEARRFSREGLPEAVGLLCEAARQRLRESARAIADGLFARRGRSFRRRIRRALS